MIRPAKLLAAIAIVALCLGGVSRAAEATDPEKPKAPAAEEPKTKPDLTVKLAKRETKRRWRGRERTITVLSVEITNTTKKTLVLPYPLDVKLTAKDAAGKAVPEREDPRRRGAPEKKAGEEKKEEEKPKRDPKKAVRLTVFKAGQTYKYDLRWEIYRLAFPEKGKYKVSAVLEVEPDEEEVLPGMKLWSGKVTSNKVEWEVTRVRNPRPQPEPKKDPKKNPVKVEEF